MKIVCQKNELLNGVNTVLKAVSTRKTLPILECILLQATEKGVRLVSNDLELGIETYIVSEIIELGSVALDAKIFSEIVKKLPDDKVEISVDVNNYTTINCYKTKFNISGQPGLEFIHSPLISKDKHIIISQFKLKEMIRQTIFSTSLEEIRPILTGELLEIRDNKLIIVSLDSHRVSIRKYNVNNKVDDMTVVIPAKTLNEISKLLSTDKEDDIIIYFTEKHILFELYNTIIISRLLEGEFPKYEQIFSKDYDTLVTINKKDLLMSIERAALISRDNDSPIKIKINNNNMIMTSNAKIVNVYEEIDIQKEGKDLEIGFNPKYLIDVLKAIDEEEINMQFTNSFNPCIISNCEKDDYKYLVLPIRIKK